MANIIIRNEARDRVTDRIMDQYHADRSDKNMREAAEVMAARTHEALESAKETRRYYYASH